MLWNQCVEPLRISTCVSVIYTGANRKKERSWREWDG